MSVTVSVADRAADLAAGEEGLDQAGSLLPAVELPRKRKGDVEERSGTHVQQSDDFPMDDDISRSEAEDQQVKMKCFREPHRQIEKRRRDKMNNLIDELSAMIPACQPMARKLDKLTVLRKAVQHLKTLKAGTSSAFNDTTYKPSILPLDDLRHLLLRAADGFLLIVSCDRAKILFISESVSKILNFSQLELTGQSLFDFIHPKDIHKVKEQLASSEYPRHRLIDAATGVQVQVDAPVRPPHLSPGARRTFFCRMKHSRVAGKQEDKHLLPCPSKKKDTYRYCTLHCTGYMRSLPSSQLDSDGDADKETSNLSCLVTVCRLLSHSPHQPSKDVNVKPSEFITRCAIDGKFTFVEQQGPGHTRDEAGSSKALQEDIKQIPIIPGLSSGVGMMIYAGSIGTQIANELVDSYRMNSSPSSGASSPFGPAQEKGPLVSPQTSTSASSREEAAASSSQSQPDSRTVVDAGSATSESSGEPSQLDLDSMVVPGLSSFSSDEAAMAVIMSLLESDVNMGQSGDFEDLHWPF
ncbi:basic helix-loop-helix ARNT-like protein 1 isoform X4 [Sebastes fasciatus]|uniref:basic helix-loop-helix ARNT-like protein 1 isoform X4 n=1 Tax=Sebastes fasciatus TaxID=394691 RepID=UPI003D9E088A